MQYALHSMIKMFFEILQLLQRERERHIHADKVFKLWSMYVFAWIPLTI